MNRRKKTQCVQLAEKGACGDQGGKLPPPAAIMPHLPPPYIKLPKQLIAAIAVTYRGRARDLRFQGGEEGAEGG